VAIELHGSKKSARNRSMPQLSALSKSIHKGNSLPGRLFLPRPSWHAVAICAVHIALAFFKPSSRSEADAMSGDRSSAAARRPRIRCACDLPVQLYLPGPQNYSL